MSIRAADPSDLDAIIGLIHALALYEREPTSVVLDRAELSTHLFSGTPRAEVIVAEVGGEVVGFALYFHNFSTWMGKPGIYIEDLFVKEEHRKKGLGRELFVEVARIGISRGCARMEWAVLDWNTPAIDFYASFGAVPMTAWTTHRLAGDALERLAGSGWRTGKPP